jgi:hypothetical protein
MLPRKNAIWISQDQGATWCGPFYLDDQVNDGGYGDIRYNPTADQWVVVSYQGDNNGRCDLKQYNLVITGI